MDAAELTVLIGRAQKREAAAFDALVDLYASRLYGYFYRLTSSREDAEDLLQELFVRLVRMIEHYEHDGRFDGWVFRIATNLVRDRVRRSRKTRSAGLDAAAPREMEEGDPLGGLPDPTVLQPIESLD